MTDEKPTIETLFSDNGPFDEVEVIKALQPHVTIQKASKEVYFKGSKLSADQKILAYGLAKKLLKSKDLLDRDTITAQEIFDKTGMKKGTIDPTFKALRERGLLVGKREYEIPISKIQDVINLLKAK